jgi:transcriptional repressor NrdR
MKCPYCNNPGTKVLDSRDAEDLELTRRRRECEKCERRFTTYERVEMLDLFIIKKDGRREPFSDDKLRNGVIAACQKRPIPRQEVEKLVEQVKLTLKGLDSTEIPSSEVGELVMAGLKKLDKVAYIRFASIHKQFEDLSEFKKEIQKAEKS